MAAVDLLPARFAPRPRLYLQRMDEVVEPATSRGRRYWVLSRGLCRFFRIPLLPDTSASRQIEALRLQIQRLSPFAATGSHFHFGSEFISLWLWDQAAVIDAAAALEVDLRRVPVLPETVLQPPGEGVRLINCLDGVEGQCWDDGSLAASRWWPHAPDNRNWVLFQRGASIQPDRLLAVPPAAGTATWLPRPWTRMPSDGWSGIANLDLRFAAAGAAAVLLVGYAYFGAEWLRLSWDIAAIEKRVEAMSGEIGPIVQARAAALDNQAAVRRLQELDPFPSQLALMARVADMLPKNETHITQWQYDHGQLEFNVAADHPLDAVFFVRTLERIDRLKGVGAERAGSDNSLRIRLTVEPR